MNGLPEQCSSCGGFCGKGPCGYVNTIGDKMTDKLKPCPCGKTPNKLLINETLSGKWAYVSGDCCSEWIIEYRNGYETGEEQYTLAVKSWNESPREN